MCLKLHPSTKPMKRSRRWFLAFSSFFEEKFSTVVFSPPSSLHTLSNQTHFYRSSSSQCIEPRSLQSPTRNRVDPGKLSFSDHASLLQICVSRRALDPGRQIHAQICLSGHGSNVNLGTKLVSLYCNCNAMSYARKVFDKMPKRNLFLWNVIIRGYAWNGPYESSLSLFDDLLDHGGLNPNNFTFPFVLKACSALSAIDKGKEIHEHAIRGGWDKDVFVGAALIDMYAKCGCVEIARTVFDSISIRDVVLWNSMLAAYAQNGHPDDALALCREMAFSGVKPSTATLVTVTSASADVAALPRGKELHGFGLRHGFESDDKVKTALVDMYAKRGSVLAARTLFERLREKRVVSWNAMITGYAMHGYVTDALDLFEKMRMQARPDHITFVGVLSACRHGRLPDNGWRYFDEMVEEFQIEPTIQHYTCLIDLLGQSGKLSEAYNLIMEMPQTPDSGVWGSLLNACKTHRNVELGELALDRLVELAPDDSGNYVIMSNIYAQVGKWEGVSKVKQMMLDRGVRKKIACSWIEVKNKVFAFRSGDTSHPRSSEIYGELGRVMGLIVEAGYEPRTETVFHDVEDDEKTGMVSSHSERLAIAFGLMCSASGSRILVMKNLRVCEDCHDAIKLISKVTQREICVRDVNRYHHFKEGGCSCGDRW